jgi:hypothetical protein
MRKLEKKKDRKFVKARNDENLFDKNNKPVSFSSPDSHKIMCFADKV